MAVRAVRSQLWLARQPDDGHLGALRVHRAAAQLVEGFNNNDLRPSPQIGLSPQLLYYDASRFDGANVGGNATQTVPRNGAPLTYQWYAGDVKINADGTVSAIPVEFGATEDAATRTAATVSSPTRGSFRDQTGFSLDSGLWGLLRVVP